eukprot:4212038-Prymnesium_polylepis.2
MRQRRTPYERVERVDLEAECGALRIEGCQLADDGAQRDRPQEGARQHDEDTHPDLERVVRLRGHVTVARRRDRRHRKVEGTCVRRAETCLAEAVRHVLVLGRAAVLIADPCLREVVADARLQAPHARNVVREDEHADHRAEDIEEAVIDLVLRLEPHPQPRRAQQLEHLRESQRAEHAQKLDLRRA